MRVFDCFRWWRVEELGGTEEALTPRSLHQIVARYLAEGPPREPLEIETLVD